MVVLRIKDKDYQLRLNTRGCVSCEKRLGKNPVNVFTEAANNQLPKIGDLMIILHECLVPYSHGNTLDYVYELYDDYCAEGGNIVSLIEKLIEVFQDAGFIPKEADSKN